jgi:hypothetical protein
VVTELAVGIAVAALLIYRQLVARPVAASALRLMVILGVIGLVELVAFFQKHHGGAWTIAALGGSLVLALVFGVLRAWTTRIWLKDGVPWTQGNWVTALLWLAAIGAHLGYDALLDHYHGTVGLGDATLVLYLAISLGAQRLIVQHRANRLLPPGSGIPFFGSGSAAGRGPAGGRGPGSYPPPPAG